MSFRLHQTWHEWDKSAFYLDSPIADDLIAIGATTSGRQQMAPLPRILQHIAPGQRWRCTPARTSWFISSPVSHRATGASSEICILRYHSLRPGHAIHCRPASTAEPISLPAFLFQRELAWMLLSLLASATELLKQSGGTSH